MGINSININIPDDILKERKTVEFKGEFSLEPFIFNILSSFVIFV